MDTRAKLKKAYRHTSEIHRKKGRDYKERLRESAAVYLKKSKSLSTNLKTSEKSKVKDKDSGLLLFCEFTNQIRLTNYV